MNYAKENVVLALDEIQLLAPGLDKLSQQELDAVQEFTLLWTIFEAQFLGSGASVKKISEIIGNQNPEILEAVVYADQLNYFKQRYIEDGQENHRFEHLHFRKNDNPELVLQVLTDNNHEPKSELIVCLTIIYRFRNNFFHGVKWAYGLQDQLANFQHSASLLKSCLHYLPRGI